MTKIVIGSDPVIGWGPSIDDERYLQAVEQIQELIRAGETYQVNFTYRLRATLSADPRTLFLRLVATASPPFGAFIETDDFAICSASPELFFHRSGAAIESRPMKGTAARGLWFEQDIEQGERLRCSEKEQAENVMIVDMVRNDLGRIARPGSVRVTNLFDVERYPTVLQLTSTIAAETDASLTRGLRARCHDRAVSAGVDYGRTQAADHGNYCGHGRCAEADLHRHDRIHRAHGARAVQRRHQNDRDQPRNRRGRIRRRRWHRRRLQRRAGAVGEPAEIEDP